MSVLTALAFTMSGVFLALYPAIRPFSDESSLQAAAAYASPSWVLAHSLAMLGFAMLGLALLGVFLRLQRQRGATFAGVGLVLSWLGVDLTLPYYGTETFGLHAVGEAALRRADPAAMSLVDAIRWEQGIAFIVVGLIVLALGTLLVAVAIRRSGRLIGWSGFPLALAFALYLPQYSTPQVVRVAHGTLVLAACLLLAWAVMRESEPESGGPRDGTDHGRTRGRPARIVVRAAQSADELDAARRITLSVYIGEEYSDPTGAPMLGDVSARASRGELLVAVDDAGAVLGTVSYLRPGSPLRRLSERNEAEMRLLAVAPTARRQGVGELLVRYCVDIARREGRSALVLSTQPTMLAAQRLYRRLGFTRVPARDHVASSGRVMRAYALWSEDAARRIGHEGAGGGGTGV